MGVFQPLGGGLQAGWGCIQNGAEGRQTTLLAGSGGCCGCASPQGKWGTAVGELMWVAKEGDCAGIQACCSGSTVHARGASKVTKNGPKCPLLPSSLGIVGGLVIQCGHHHLPLCTIRESLARGGGGCDPGAPAFLCPVLTSLLRLKWEHPGNASLERQGMQVRESHVQLPQRKANPAPGGCAPATRPCPSVVLSLVYLNVVGVRYNDLTSGN